MLQNRVDPRGNIIAVTARGSWMGNRGVLHNDQQKIVRPYKLNAWITCVLEFRGRKREVMAPNRYTELFFLDEATAFAAGHRPCYECRRQDFERFKRCWLKGNPEYGFSESSSINEIDKILHHQRIDSKGAKQTYEELGENIPDGSFVEILGKAYLVAGNHLFEWSAPGYGEGKMLPASTKFAVLTPESIVNAFRMGYHPQMRL